MDQDRFDTQETRDFACMLATCTAKAGESVIVNLVYILITETEEMRTCVYQLHTPSLPLVRE